LLIIYLLFFLIKEWQPFIKVVPMKEIVVCVDLTESCLDTLKILPERLNLTKSRVHLVHVFESPLHDEDLSPFTFPLQEQHLILEKNTIESLKRLGHDLGLRQNNLIVKCFFSLSRKDKIKSYLSESKASVVVTATRGRHGMSGLFSSSLTDFLISFSPCNVLILRPFFKN
jgi:nucleotide-binding universal stress UspA family protein